MSDPLVVVQAFVIASETCFVFVSVGVTNILVDCDAVPDPRNRNGVRLLSGQFPDLSTIDAILLTDADSMLALPYVVNSSKFCGQVFATVPATQFGMLYFEDLLVARKLQTTLPASPVGFCQPRARSQTMKCHGHGPTREHCGGQARRVYSHAHVQRCRSKIRSVSYGERIHVNGRLTVTAHPSGVSIGGAVWEVDFLAPPTRERRGAISTRSWVHGVVGKRVAAVTNRLCLALSMSVLRKQPDFIVLSNHENILSATAVVGGVAMSEVSSNRCSCPQEQAAARVPPPQARGRTVYAAALASLCSALEKDLLAARVVVLPMLPSGFMHELLHHCFNLEGTGDATPASPLGRCALVFVGSTLRNSLEMRDTLTEWTSLAKAAAKHLVVEDSVAVDIKTSQSGWENVLRAKGQAPRLSRTKQHRARHVLVDTIQDAADLVRRRKRDDPSAGLLLFVTYQPSLINHQLVSLCHALSTLAPAVEFCVCYTHKCPGSGVCTLEQETEMLRPRVPSTRSMRNRFCHHPIPRSISTLNLGKLLRMSRSPAQIVVVDGRTMTKNVSDSEASGLLQRHVQLCGTFGDTGTGVADKGRGLQGQPRAQPCAMQGYTTAPNHRHRASHALDATTISRRVVLCERSDTSTATDTHFVASCSQDGSNDSVDFTDYQLHVNTSNPPGGHNG